VLPESKILSDIILVTTKITVALIEPSSSSSKPALGEYIQAADVRVRLNFLDDVDLPTQCSTAATNTMNKNPTRNSTL